MQRLPRAHKAKATRRFLFLLALAVALGPWAADAFARKPRGFGASAPPRRTKGKVVEAEVVDATGEVRPQDTTAASKQGPTSESRPQSTPNVTPGTSPLKVVLVGGGAIGLWLALLLVVKLRGGVRIRIYDPRWESAGRTVRWTADSQESAHRCQVATIPVHIWSELPAEVQELVFQAGKFSEQWPGPRELMAAESRSESFSRNLPVGLLEDALLEAAQRPEYAQAVELVPEAYDEDEHRRLGSTDRFHVLVGADGEAAQRACDRLLGGEFGRVLAPMGSEVRTDSLAVAFDLDLASGEDRATPLTVAASTALSRAQRRFLLSWTGPTHGTLHVRLAPAEAATLGGGEVLASSPETAQGLLGEEGLWARVKDGLRLYRVPLEAVRHVARLEFDGMLRATFLAPLQGLQSPASVQPLGFLLGDAARASRAHFGPDLGISAALEGAHSLLGTLAGEGRQDWWLGQWLTPLVLADHGSTMATIRDRVRPAGSVGVERCIEMGLDKARGGKDEVNAADSERDVFLENLQFALERLLSEDLPRERVDEMPTWEELRRHVLDCEISQETLSVLASTGPWLPASAGIVAKTTPEIGSGPGVFDFGGETPEGLAQAKQLSKAARGGDRESQFQLGVMYFTANGVTKDGAAALKWLTKAAEQGHALAQNCVGAILRNGVDGQRMDKRAALSWFRKAAEQGEAEASYNLGEMYDEADGVEGDEQEAFKWYQTAAQGGLPLGLFKAGLMLHGGNGVEKDVTRGVAMIREAAEKDVPQAMQVLGDLHYSGDGVLLDKDAAAKYFKRAAEKGEPLAQYCFGVMLELGDGVAADPEAAQHWLRQAAAQGLLEAQVRCREPKLLAAPAA